MIAPKSAKPATKPSPLATENVRLRERRAAGRLQQHAARPRGTTPSRRREPTTSSDDSTRARQRLAAEARERTIDESASARSAAPGVVDPVPDGRRPRREDDAEDDERDRAERQVDVEDPAPGEVVDEEAAEQRADDGGDAEHAAEVAPGSGRARAARRCRRATAIASPSARRRRGPGSRGTRSAPPCPGPGRTAPSRRGRSRSPSAARACGRRGRRACRRAA